MTKAPHISLAEHVADDSSSVQWISHAIWYGHAIFVEGLKNAFLWYSGALQGARNRNGFVYIFQILNTYILIFLHCNNTAWNYSKLLWTPGKAPLSIRAPCKAPAVGLSVQTSIATGVCVPVQAFVADCAFAFFGSGLRRSLRACLYSVAF